MKVLFVTSEVVPFAKTGGLADVSGALPPALATLGDDVRIIMPLHRSVRQAAKDLTDTGLRVRVPVGDKTVVGELWQARLPRTAGSWPATEGALSPRRGPRVEAPAGQERPGLPKSQVPVYCLRQDGYFDREGLYGTTGTDAHPYPDNCERFVFFSRAVVEALLQLDFRPDLLHLNDWQTALIAPYLKTLYRDQKKLSSLGTLVTVHNLLYQGIFWHWDLQLTGLGWSLFNWRQLEFYGKLNLLKGGLVFADFISTVSPTYARQIQTPAFGNGLEGVLAERRDRLVGIVNGIDGEVWNPETDALLPARYSARKVTGKAACKAALQKESGLAKAPRTPLVGMISRLVAEKGFDLVREVLPGLLRQGVQVVILGTGEAKYHEAFAALAKEAKGFAAYLTFDNRLAHLIEAGADVFLMPSLVEPCGLNQLYSLRYGTVPVVHRTGGLADTITDYNPQSLLEGKANGFVLESPTVPALTEALDRALTLYRTNPKAWQQLQLVGMKQDWSWSRSARDYHALYERVASAAAKP